MTSATTLGYVLRLRDQGWRGLLPVLPHDAVPAPWLKPGHRQKVLNGRGKAPGRYLGDGFCSLLGGWPTYPDDEQTIEVWSRWPNVNAGMRAAYDGSTVHAIDVDTLHPEVTAEIGSLILQFLDQETKCGPSLPFRVGQAPKSLIMIRLERPTQGTGSHEITVGGLKNQVELLGAGQQFVVLGMHRSGTPYRWYLDHPAEMDPAQLPLLSDAGLKELFRRIDAKLLTMGKAVAGSGAHIQAASEPCHHDLESRLAPNPAEAVEAAMALQNGDLPYQAWLRRLYAIYGALGEEGRAAADLFSRKSSKYDERDTLAHWERIGRTAARGRLRSSWHALRSFAQADGWQPWPNPAQPFIDREQAKFRSERQSEPKEDKRPRLPDFPAPAPDREAALAAMRTTIGTLVTDAFARIDIRGDLVRAEEEAEQEVEDAFLDEVGVIEKGQLDRRQKGRLGRRKGKAAKEMRKEVLALHGLTEEPWPQLDLVNATPGSGKTWAMIQALAPIKRHRINFYLPTVAKADEVVDDYMAADGRMESAAYRGRLQEQPGQPKGGLRMCGQPPELIRLALWMGIRIAEDMCRVCPMRFGCAHIEQKERLQEMRDGFITMAHELAFNRPSYLAADLHVIDESIVGGFAITEQVDPNLLFAPGLWSQSQEGEKVARAVALALETPGKELALLRAAEVDDDGLKRCAAYLGYQHDTRLLRIRDALATGRPGDWADAQELMEELARHAYQPLRRIFSNLRHELPYPRDAANSTRRIWTEQTVVVDGRERKERVLHYCTNRPRKHSLDGKGKRRGQGEVVLLDGTGSYELNHLVFDRPVNEHRFSIERLCKVIQLTNVTNSTYRLLKRPDAGRYRAKLAAIIGHLHALHGDKLFVGSTMKIEKKLVEEGVLEGMLHLHFNEERGLNLAEDCEIGLVIGREQPKIEAVENWARAFARDRFDEFRSALDANGKGELPVCTRSRRLRDGSTVLAEVRAHPDPICQLFHEQAREGGCVQTADRIRGLWESKTDPPKPKLVILATNLPVDMTIDVLATENEFMAELAQVPTLVEEVEGRGWAVEVPVPVERGRELELVTDSGICKRTLLQNRLSVTNSPALLPVGGRTQAEATLWTTLTPAETVRQAVVEYPGLRTTPPPGGVLCECWRRHGLVPGWADLQRMVPDLVPDAVALKSVQDDERALMKRIKAEGPTVAYKVPGRPGQLPTVAFDPTRIADIAATMVEKFGHGTTVEQVNVKDE